MDKSLITKLKIENFEAHIYRDDNPQNPRYIIKPLGTIVCFHDKYVLGDPHNFSSLEELTNEMNSGLYYYLPIYILHPNILYIFTTLTYIPKESSQIGYIFIEKKKAAREAPQKVNVEKWALETLKEEVQEYNCYLTGEVYGYILYDPIGTKIHSCWNYYGPLESIFDQMEHDIITYIKYTKAKINKKINQTKNYLYNLLPPEKLKEAFNFLEDLDKDPTIKDFRRKIGAKGYLRTPLKSQLKILINCKDEEIIDTIIDTFLFQQIEETPISA